jgi:hypothetical protein
MSSTLEILNEFGTQLQKDLRDGLDKHKSNASDMLRQSITFNVKFKSDTEITFKLELDEYYKFVDEGRKAGKRPPTDAIFKWIVQKGLAVHKLNYDKHGNVIGGVNLTAKGTGKQLKVHRTTLRSMIETQRKTMAFLIARKIGKYGTKGTGFYKEVVNDSLFDDLREKLSQGFVKDVLIELKEL